MKFGHNALTVLEKRYLRRDSAGNLQEKPEDMLRRVACAVAQADAIYPGPSDPDVTASLFYSMMSELDFLPNSPTLMNAGSDLGQLSACFVLPVEDSMEDIFEAVKQAALIHKSGGGTGFSFSRLRPQGSPVKSTGGIASGPVSFMKVFNMATEAVKQGGTRRGANMGMLRVDHPDIMEFIHCKENNSELTNFNISIGVTEAFMQAAEAGQEYSLVDPSTGLITGALNAASVFDHLVQAAWSNGEPGIIFLDRLNRDNVVPELGEIESTNPCGEQPLLPYESCNLGSINLANMLYCDSCGYNIDYSRLEQTVINAVHFLDNVIDINRYPLEIVAEKTKQTRKIGLGVMGFADMLLRLRIPYHSDQAVELAEQVMKFINQTGHDASIRLAETRGAFPAFEQSIYAKQKPVRNATVTTIAPTGTLSILANCSSGIEPVFAFAYRRNILDGAELTEVNPVLREALEERNLYSDELIRTLMETGSLQQMDGIPDEIRSVFVCAHDISPEYHIRMQAAFQQHTDNAVSKTVNFHNSATMEDVSKAFRLAWKLGCKGTTIYRDGSRNTQTLKTGGSIAGSDKYFVGKVTPRPRSDSMPGFTRRMKTGCGNLYVTVNYDETGICEVFTSTGKAGGCPSQSEATARLASIALRSGVDVSEVIRQLQGIRCPSTVRQNSPDCTSCPDAIARAIRDVEQTLKPEHKHTFTAVHNGREESESPDGEAFLCPECHHPMAHESGCTICQNCGYSRCG